MPTEICIYPECQEFHSSGGYRNEVPSVALITWWDLTLISVKCSSGFCVRVGPVCTHELPHQGKKRIKPLSVPNLIRFPKLGKGKTRVQVWELKNNSGIHQKLHRCHKKGVFSLEWLFSQKPSYVQKNLSVPGLTQDYQSSVQTKFFPHHLSTKAFPSTIPISSLV